VQTISYFLRLNLVVEMKPFPMDVRNKLVNSGRVSVHHFLTQSERVISFGTICNHTNPSFY
ncbi:MAG: hypothetical protein WAK17_12800, partial [Candidatus Nitrosopolaris sp.]